MRIPTVLAIVGALCLSGTAVYLERYGEVDFDALREAMVRDQIEARGITHPRVLAAMRHVPRHLFVPEAYRRQAYEDHPLPIGLGQTISQPYIVAFMTEAAAPDAQDRVLEIGTGSGYQAAVLAEIVSEVYTIEILPELADQARERLSRLGYENVWVKTGDGYLGWPEHAPFDAIIVTAAPEQVPAPLIDQLAPAGRMVIPVGPRGDVQSLRLIEKAEDGTISERELLPVRFVPLVRHR